jgi:flagellar basal body-associated protein FliL
MGKNKKTLWLILILIFVGMFLLASVMALQTSSTHITQTYRSYENTKRTEITTYRSYENHRITDITRNPTRTSHSTDWNYRTPYSYERRYTNTASYKQHATQETRKDFLGSYVKEYSVSVTNKERTGKYYTVMFNLKDKNGYKFSQSMTQYLRDGENKKFVYKDIQFERHEIVDWNYEIIPESF